MYFQSFSLSGLKIFLLGQLIALKQRFLACNVIITGFRYVLISSGTAELQWLKSCYLSKLPVADCQKLMGVISSNSVSHLIQCDRQKLTKEPIKLICKTGGLTSLITALCSVCVWASSSASPVQCMYVVLCECAVNMGATPTAIQATPRPRHRLCLCLACAVVVHSFKFHEQVTIVDSPKDMPPSSYVQLQTFMGLSIFKI